MVERRNKELGRQQLLIHRCQITGGQYIDASIVNVTEQARD